MFKNTLGYAIQVLPRFSFDNESHLSDLMNDNVYKYLETKAKNTDNPCTWLLPLVSILVWLKRVKTNIILIWWFKKIEIILNSKRDKNENNGLGNNTTVLHYYFCLMLYSDNRTLV